MEGYIISVSAGKGCYRHIQINQSATLYKLHQAIIAAFEFDDDHCHAFFMDNKYWGHGDTYFSVKSDSTDRLTKSYRLERLGLEKGRQFKYLFDFGDEWWFQCKVLRTVEERTDIPKVIRSVGEPPVQYPEEEWEDEEDWDGEENWEDEEEDDQEEELTREQIEALYSAIPLKRETIALIHRYADAAARLYGLISLNELWELYNSQNSPVEAAAFLMTMKVLDFEDNDYYIIKRTDIPHDTLMEELCAIEIAAEYLFLDNPDQELRDMRRQQQGKPLKKLPKAEFLRFAEHDYYPRTPQRRAMIDYLRRREKSLTMDAEAFCDCIQSIIVIDARMQDVVDLVEKEGLVFNSKWDIGEFASLYQNLNNHTHKHANRGHTPDELFMQSQRGKQLAERIAPPNQLSFFDEPPEKLKLTIVGKPARNAPCPCGSGRKYKNCCGK